MEKKKIYIYNGNFYILWKILYIMKSFIYCGKFYILYKKVLGLFRNK